MTEPPRGGFFLGRSMNEDNTNAAAEADKIEPSQEVVTQSQQPTDQVEDGADRQDDEGDADGQDQEEAGADGDDEERKPRGKSRSERQARQIARLKAQVEELQSGRGSSPVQDNGSVDAAIEAKIGKPPKESDFDDWFAYRDANAAYQAKKGIVELQIKEDTGRQRRAQADRMSALADDYDDNVKEAAEKIPDLVATLEKSTFKPTEVVALLLLESGEKAPLIAYHLAKNERDAARLNQMSERQALREIGRIEALVSLPRNNATRAPTPIARPKSGASPNRSLGKSMSDYERWRNSDK